MKKTVFEVTGEDIDEYPLSPHDPAAAATSFQHQQTKSLVKSDIEVKIDTTQEYTQDDTPEDTLEDTHEDTLEKTKENKIGQERIKQMVDDILKMNQKDSFEIVKQVLLKLKL